MWIDLWYCCTIVNTNGYMCVVNTAECLSQAENGQQQLHVAYSICSGEYSPFSLSMDYIERSLPGDKTLSQLHRGSLWTFIVQVSWQTELQVSGVLLGRSLHFSDTGEASAYLFKSLWRQRLLSQWSYSEDGLEKAIHEWHRRSICTSFRSPGRHCIWWETELHKSVDLHSEYGHEKGVH